MVQLKCEKLNFKWGYGTLEEMCTNMIYYYPRIENFDYCYSTTQVETLLEFYNSLMQYN